MSYDTDEIEAGERALAILKARGIAPEPSLRKYIALDARAFDDLLELKQQPIDAVPTPLAKWNARCRDFGGGVGLARGWHVTLGANTGHGKSLFALNMAWVAVQAGEKVGFVSLEMSWEQLATRFMSIVSGEKIKYLEPGAMLNPVMHKQAARSVERLQEQTSGKVITNLRQISALEDVDEAIRFLFEYEGCRFIVVDYMQLVKVTGSNDILDGVTRISSAVRGTAQTHRLVTIGLSQFNRTTSADHEHSPTPQGLMGGSPLENDSDQVILIDHTTYERHPAVNTAKQTLILGKNRHGASCEIECEWNYDNLRISEVAA